MLTLIVETDTTYNATIFDFNTMKRAVVARIHSNKEEAEFYNTAINLKWMFQTCHKDYPQFKPENLKGIIVN